LIGLWHDARGELFVQRSSTIPNVSAARKEADKAAKAFRESYSLEPTPARLAKYSELALTVSTPDFAAITSLIESNRDSMEGSPLLRGLYAAALTGQGRNSEAVEQMRLAWAEHTEILELQPNDRRGLVNWYQMLKVVLTDQDPAEYERVVRELADGQPSALSLVWTARVWSAGRDTEGLTHAIALLDAAASRCPEDDNELRALIGLDRGYCHVGVGNYREATDSFETIVALAASDPNVPDHALALNNAAFLYAEYLDDPGRAVAYAERADAAKPDDPSILDTLGWALCKLGKYADAEDALIRSKNIRPSPDNRLHLAWVFYETGKPHRDVRNQLLLAKALSPSPATQAQIDELNKKLRR